MGRKRVVLLSFAVLALLAGVAVYFVVTAGTNGSGPDTPESPERNARPSGDSPAPLENRPEEFDAARLQPDPVIDETPPQPYESAPDAMRLIVAGRVIDSDGAGVSNARVTFVGEQRLRDLTGHGYTDHAGNYRLLAWVPKPGGTVASDRFGRVYAETSDGGLGVGDSVAIEDVPEFRMPDVKVPVGSSIEGTVLTTQGDPVPGAQVTARSSGAVQVITTRGRGPAATRRQFVRSVFADAAGRFRLGNLPPAEYRVTVHGGFFGLETEASIVDLRNGGTQWHDPRVEPVRFIRGAVLDQFGQPVENAVVRAILDDGSDTPTDRSRDGALDAVRIMDRRGDTPLRRFDEDRRSSRHQVTDAQGRFGFHNLPAGVWKVVCKVGDSEIVKNGVVLGGELELKVEVATAVGGIVRDLGSGRAVENFNVRLVRGPGATQVSPFQRVSRDGQFQFHPAGRYAFANPPAGVAHIRVSAPGFVPAILDAGEIRPGDQRRDLDVKLQPLCELNLTLKRDDRALGLEPVALLFDDRLAYAASTDEFGTARIPDVAPAAYRVKLVRADGRVLVGDLTVPAQPDASLTLELTPES